MNAPVVDRHVEITPGIAGGKPRIAGHRITVQNIVGWHEYVGKSADEIATEYRLSLADGYAALADYFDYQAEISHSIQADECFVTTQRQQTPSLVQTKLQAWSDGLTAWHQDAVFDCEQSRVRQIERIEVLLIGIACATSALWMLERYHEQRPTLKPTTVDPQPRRIRPIRIRIHICPDLCTWRRLKVQLDIPPLQVLEYERVFAPGK